MIFMSPRPSRPFSDRQVWTVFIRVGAELASNTMCFLLA